MEIQIISAQDLPLANTFKFKCLNIKPNALVEIVTERFCWRTGVVKSNIAPRWDAKCILPPLEDSSKITFNVLHSGTRGRDKSLGRLDMGVKSLLELQHHQINENIVLTLSEQSDSLPHGSLTIRVTQQGLMSSAARAVGQSRAAEKRLLDVATDDSNQGDLAMSIGALLVQFNVLVNVVNLGDRLTKIHPYLNFAWEVLSVGLRMATAQQVRDQRVSDLVKTMEATYSFVSLVKDLEKNPSLQRVVEQILKLTIDCGFFIQDYVRRNFTRRAIVQSFSSTGTIIANFSAEFGRLQKNFTVGIDLDAALRLSRTAAVIDSLKQNELLSRLRPADMDEYNRSSCLPNTRQDIIQLITAWVADASQKTVLWLYGMAGSGKSTLLTTIAEEMRSLQRLGAFFFFDRNHLERNASVLIRTLASQLAIFDPQISVQLSQVVEGHPNIIQMSLAVQFANLLSEKAMDSIEWSRGPIVLLIDALDECGNERDRRILMQALSEGFSSLPPFIRVIVTSRPERDITNAFSSHPAVFPYYLDIDSKATGADISQFLRHRLGEIRRNNADIPFDPDWPGDDKIRTLTQRAAGLFIWASTACSYIDSHDPRCHLDELFSQVSTDGSSPFAHLDQLYTTALKSAGNWTDSLFCSDYCDIFGVILCSRIPLPCSVIDSLLDLPRTCLRSISRLGCVLHWGEKSPVRIIHPSFHDYLTSRCCNEPWSIDIQEHNQKLAIHCIELLNKSLHENICGLQLPHLVQGKSMPDAVSYACRFWVEHVCLIACDVDNIGERIYGFLAQHLLHWIEALAILKCHSNTIQSLHDLLIWLKKHLPSHNNLYQLVYDAYRFVQYFANTIQEHPLLIYATALPFTPRNTILYQTFHRHSLPKVVCGVQMAWEPQMQMMRGHTDFIHSVAFSPDDTKVVSAAMDQTIRVWDTSTGIETLPPIRGHDDSIFSVAFSPEGAKIASGSKDKTIRLWDAGTGIEIHPPFRGHEGSVFSVAFSSDGTKIVSGSSDKTLRLWDAITGIEKLAFRGHESYVWSVAFSPDGSKVVSGSSDNTVRIWDTITGNQLLPPIQGHNDRVWTVAFSPGSSKVVSLRGHEDSVRSVAFSPDGTRVASSSRDKTIRIWDLSTSTGEEAALSFRGHSDCVRCLAWSHDGTKLVSGSWDHTIRVWDASAKAEKSPSLQGHSDSVLSVRFAPDGTKVVSGSSDKTIRVWSADAGTEMLSPLQEHSDSVRCITFSPDGTKFASASNDKTIRVWDLSTGRQTLPPLQGHDDSVRYVAYSPDGSKIASASWDKTIRLWDANTGAELPPPFEGHDDHVRCVAFSPGGSKLVSGSSDKTIRVWDVATSAQIREPIRGHENYVWSVAFSPDESKIISRSMDDTIRVWNASTGLEMIPSLRGLDISVSSVAFSGDGTKIIFWSDEAIRIWDASTGTELSPDQITALMPILDGPSIIYDNKGWFRSGPTGSVLSRPPVELSCYRWTIRGSCCVGWTHDDKLLLVHFPTAAIYNNDF